jgi:hypothetical protein
MTRPSITIHNVQTDQIEIREMNDDEFIAYEILLANAEAEAEAKTLAEAAKATAEAKLAALGLLPEDLIALGIKAKEPTLIVPADE